MIPKSLLYCDYYKILRNIQCIKEIFNISNIYAITCTVQPGK